jgi:hypothetical protein
MRLDCLFVTSSSTTPIVTAIAFTISTTIDDITVSNQVHISHLRMRELRKTAHRPESPLALYRWSARSLPCAASPPVRTYCRRRTVE